MFGYIRKSLNRKILLVLSASVALVMATVIYLTVERQTREMLKEMFINSEEIAEALHAGIKYPMAKGDNSAVERHLLEIREKMPDLDVYICNTEQKITFSSHEGTIQSDMKRYIRSSEALSALTIALTTAVHPERSYEEQVSMHRNLIHIHTVFNEPECHRCHGSAKNVLGAIVLKKSTDRYYASIAGLRNSNLLISMFGIGAIVLIVHTLMSSMVIRPVGRLAADLRILPERLSNNDPFAIPEIRRKDEIGELQDTFNQMAVDIVEKTHHLEVSREGLAKANRELEAFAYSVSHDLRAPLRNIDGFSKILLDDYGDRIDDRAKHYLTRVRNGTARMSVLIDDMLAFSRIGRAELQMRETDLGKIIEVIRDHYSQDIQDRQISIIVEKIPFIRCDPTLMQSLLSNLISNAVKFTRGVESPVITIGYLPGRHALFVRDNGVGFDMKYHDKVFQVFQRLHLPEEYEGTGIGLAIVKRIAERHHGAAWAESESGQGAVFYVSFPPENIREREQHSV